MQTACTLVVVLAVVLVALGLRSVLPGGAAASGSLRLRSLLRAGVPGARATSVVLVSAGVVAVTLCAVFGAGLLMTAGRFASDGWILSASIVVAAVLVGVGVFVWLCTRRLGGLERATVRLVRPFGRWSRRLEPDATTAFVHRLGTSVRELARNPRSAAWACGLSVGNWLLDAAALWLVCLAVGARPAIGVLVVVYALGNLLAMAPITPGGIGIVETAMVSGFVVAGVDPGPALLAVVGWRVVEYWLPILAAGIALSILAATLERRDASRRRARVGGGADAGGRDVGPCPEPLADRTVTSRRSGRRRHSEEAS